MRALLLTFLFAACTDFTDVPRGVCGNGLLEPGEDCDTGAANCVRCAVTCDVASDCPSSAYACGIDGFCHAPGGQLADPTAPVTFQADDFRVTDIDRDGAGDVLGVSKTSIVVRKGDAAGALATTSSFVTPAQSGPPAFGDVDGDGAIDVTLSTPDGIVSYTSRFGTLSPVAIESPLFDGDGQRLDFQRLFQVTAFDLGGMIDLGGGTGLVVISFLANPPRVDVVQPCLARLGALAPAAIDDRSVDIYRVTPDTALDNEIVVSFLTTAGQPCVTSMRGNALGGYTFADITPAGANQMANKPILADLDTDNDPCPDLVNSDGGGGALRIWPGKQVAGRCVLDPAGAGGALIGGVQAGAPGAVAIGRIELRPAIPGFGRDALVLTSGVMVHVPVAIPLGPPQGVFEIYSSAGRELAFVATADLDNDGDLDAVLASREQDDLDVLFRFPGGVQLLRIDTASQVSSLTLGDFDGNGIEDIAYTETEGDHHDLMIAYGTGDRPLDPVQVATFSGVGSVSVLQFADSVDTLGLAEDLAIIQPGAGVDGGSLMSLLHGSPQRTMLSFFDPRVEALRSETVLRGAVIGDFVDGDPAVAHRDLIAFGAALPGSTAGMRAWRVGGTELGLDTTPSDGVVANGLADCTGSGVCVRSAEYLAFPIVRTAGSEARDVVLAVDREQPPRAVLLDPYASTSSLSRTDVPVLAGAIPAGTTVRSLHAVDVDGDGARELVAAFASDAGGDVLVCTLSTAGVPESCTGLTAQVKAIAPTVSACIDATPLALGSGTLDDTPGSDLVILCREGETTSLFALAGGEVIALEAHAPGMRRIRAGDVTGDGVDDVIAIVGTGGSQSLIVFRQCDSRELGACRRATPREGR